MFQGAEVQCQSTLSFWRLQRTDFHRMVSIRIMIKLAVLSILVASFRCCNADISLSDELGIVWSCDSRADNSTTAAFKANLNSLLRTLEKKAPENYGFYINTAAVTSDIIYGLVQCMGDITAQDCTSCIKDSIKWAQERCKNSNDVAIWLNRCFLRYSDRNFLGQWNSSATGLVPNVSSRTDSPSVAVRGQDLMHLLSSDVPYQPFLFKTGSVDVGKEGTRYGLVQCNRDLNKSSCYYCIENMLPLVVMWSGNDSSYMMVSYGCRMWYDSYKFYSNDTVPSIVPNDAPMPTDSGLQLHMSVTATVAALILIIVTISAL